MGRILSRLAAILGLPGRRPVAGGLPPSILRGSPWKGTLRLQPPPEPDPMNDLISVPDAICILRIALVKQPFNQLIREALVQLGDDPPPDPTAIVRRPLRLCTERDCNGDRCYLAPGHSGDHAVLDPRGTFKTPCSFPTCKAAGVCPPTDPTSGGDHHE